MSDRSTYIDIYAGAPEPDNASEGESSAMCGRPWLSVWFTCCSMYARVYRDRTGQGYLGRCPRCGSIVRARIGPGGTSQRTFRTL